MNDESIIIVDEKNSVIGTKKRHEIDYSKDIYRSTALWITNSNNEVLLAQRSLNKLTHPGLWGPATAGTVDENETYDSNIIKEVREEIGLIGFNLQKSEQCFIEDPHRQFIQWYTLKIDREINEFIKQDEEVEKLAWVPLDQFLHDININPNKYVPTLKAGIEFLVK